MTSVPYPCFVNEAPVTEERKALAAVGRCRVDLRSSSSLSANTKFQAIVDKNQQQALVGVTTEKLKQQQQQDEAQEAAAGKDGDGGAAENVVVAAAVDKEEEERQKKEKKKLMKEGNALAAQFFADELKLDLSVVDVDVVVDPQALIATDGCLAACLLDAGCSAIVTDGTNLDALEAAKVPKSRLVAHFTHDSSSSSSTNNEAYFERMEQISALCQHVSFEIVDNDNAKESLSSTTVERLLKQMPQHTKVTFQFAPKLVANTTDLSKVVASMCRAGKDGRSTVGLTDPTAAELGHAFAACIVTDRADGLYTTVVCTRNGEALGLVYSSAASIIAALESGRGVYYSRSRKGLWRKGDTSGHYQSLHRLDVDCDGDALRFTVTQRGDDLAAFCHLNTLTCWGPPRGLRHLEETLQDRLTSAPAGSYTKRLFDDTNLLRDKLVEEAQELSEAQEPQHVAEELADVLYFAMTRAVKAGVSLDDAVAELDKRARKVTRRKGDSKAFRIAAGQAILDKSKEESG